MKFLFPLLFLICVTVEGLAQSPTTVGDLPKRADDNLSDGALKDFNEHARQKVEMFQNYLTIIADKMQPLEKRMAAQRQAEELFIQGPGILIEVSSVNNPEIKRYTVQKYLERVFNAQGYTQTKITFYDTCRISDWKKIGERKYEAIATIYQKFEGYRHGKLIYGDLTRKKVEVELDHLRDPTYDVTRYNVLLGNVTVAETRRLKVNQQP